MRSGLCGSRGAGPPAQSVGTLSPPVCAVPKPSQHTAPDARAEPQRRMSDFHASPEDGLQGPCAPR